MDSLPLYIDYLSSLAVKTSRDTAVVYTVLIGEGDFLRSPAVVEKNTIYVCFSDSLKECGAPWRVVPITQKYRDDRRTSRVFKMMPHKLFPYAETTAYVDASIVIKRSVSELIDAYCGGQGVSLFVHPSRGCAYVEAQACIDQKKDEVSVLSSQIAAYRKEGFPENYGLFAGGVIICRGRGDGLHRLLEKWLSEVDKFSLRDQVSLPYVAWNQRAIVNAIPLDIYDNRYFQVLPHAAQDERAATYRLRVFREHIGRVARRLLRATGMMPRRGGGR